MAARKSARQLRIESELHRVVADMVAREVRDPRVGRITVTAVEAASDLSYARILYVPFGGSADLAAVQTGLSRAASFLRGEVGRRLALRHAPRLEFVFDESIERADHLTTLIDGAIRKDRSTREEDPPA
jgi:ribosome-binding factor A